MKVSVNVSKYQWTYQSINESINENVREREGQRRVRRIVGGLTGLTYFTVEIVLVRTGRGKKRVKKERE